MMNRTHSLPASLLQAVCIIIVCFSSTDAEPCKSAEGNILEAINLALNGERREGEREGGNGGMEEWRNEGMGEWGNEGMMGARIHTQIELVRTHTSSL